MICVTWKTASGWFSGKITFKKENKKRIKQFNWNLKFYPTNRTHTSLNPEFAIAKIGLGQQKLPTEEHDPGKEKITPATYVSDHLQSCNKDAKHL